MTTEVDRIPLPQAAPVPTRVGQATAVEQSRAMAEVQAAVVVAQQRPRDTQAALSQMRDSCRQMRLAERAFYRFNRAGTTVSGPTVHLARELARVWGNIQYGIAELSRDDVQRQSEMQAWAWDLQTNTRSSQTFIVPHMRDKRGGPEPLPDLRSIYEESTNQGARRLRQAIWSVLPPWLIDEAEELCNQTLTDGGGKPLPQRIADALAGFVGFKVSQAQLEQRLDRPVAKWTEHDVAQLGIIYKSLQRGEIRVEDEFPTEPVTADEILRGNAPQRRARRPSGEPQPEPGAGATTGEVDTSWPEVKGPPA